MREVPRISPLAEKLLHASQPNLLDKAIRWFDPVRGAARMKARMAMAVSGGYQGGKKDRRQTKNWTIAGNSADQDILPDLETLRERSRDLCRNEPIALGAVNTNVANVIGTGLDLSCRVDYQTLGWTPEKAAEWKALVERRFRMWASSKNCDITRTQNFYELQSLSYRSVIENGDAVVLLPMQEVYGFPFETRIQVIEADRLSNPGQAIDTTTRVAGVELDEFGAPVAYHICKQHPGTPNFSRDPKNWDRVPAFGSQTGRRTALHLYDRLRPGQTRGVPYLAPVIEHLKMLGRFTEAELDAAVVSSMLAVFVTSENGGGFDDLTGTGEATSTDPKRNLKLEPGLVAELAPGEKIETVTPGRPNAAFDPFLQAILRQIGVALEIPFELLIKHFTASYSASLAAVQLAWQFFRRRREWVISNLCQPAYEAWMDEQVAMGEIPAPGYFEDALARQAYLSSEWVGDAQLQLDPGKAADSAEKKMRLGLSTLAEETIALTGRNWEENLVQRAQEKRAHEAAGVPYLQGVNAAQPAQGVQQQDPQDPKDPNEETE